jgi:hypothetical protein
LPNDVNELVSIIQGLGVYDLVAADFYGCTIPDHRLGLAIVVSLLYPRKKPRSKLAVTVSAPIKVNMP